MCGGNAGIALLIQGNLEVMTPEQLKQFAFDCAETLVFDGKLLPNPEPEFHGPGFTWLEPEEV